MPMLRRDFLRRAAAVPLASGAGALWAASAATPRLLVVFLRGAYDAASVLVPVGSDDYYEARPRIAIARPGSGAEAALALPDQSDWGLAPAWAESLLPLYERGQLAAIPFAGTHDLSRSHFETQDHIELGQVGQQGNEACGIVEPAVQGQQFRAVFVAAAQCGELAARAVQGNLPHQCGHPCACLRASAASAAMWPGVALSAGM